MQSGSVSDVLTYLGTGGDGLSTYCKEYIETVKSTGLVVVNIQTSAISLVEKLAQLVAFVYVDGRLTALNYDVAQTTGGFSVSASASETLLQGNRSIRICASGRAVDSWTATYSVSVLK